MMQLRHMCLLALASTASSNPAYEATEADLDAAELPNDRDVDKVLVRLAKLRIKHKTNSGFFHAYNRLHDRHEPGLGTQEIRTLLRDIALGSFALRTPLAELTIRVLDSNFDGLVGEAELGVGLDVAACWADGLEWEVTSRIGRLRKAIEMAVKTPSFPVLASVLEEQLHIRCGEPIKRLWAKSDWAAILATHEARLRRAIPELTNVDDVDTCEVHVVALLLGTTPEETVDVRASRQMLRVALERLGVRPLFARHLMAVALIAAFDEDKDGALGEEELLDASSILCAAWHALDGRAASEEVPSAEAAAATPGLFGIVRAITTGDFDLDDFEEQLVQKPTWEKAAAGVNGLKYETLEAAANAIRESRKCTPSDWRAALAARHEPRQAAMHDFARTAGLTWRLVNRAVPDVLTAAGFEAIIDAYVRIAPREAIGVVMQPTTEDKVEL